MPESDFVKLLIFFEKKFKSWGIAILISILGGFGGLCYIVGVYKENWNGWRKNTDNRVYKIETYIDNEKK